MTAPRKPWTHHRPSRQSRGYGREWDRLRLVILKRDCYLCQGCARKGRVQSGNEVHHRKPKAAGGTDAMDNLETLCHSCHLEADAAALGRSKPRPRRRYDAKGYRIE